MKKLLGAFFLSISAWLVHAQGLGQVSINNRIGTEVNARIVLCGDPAGTSSVGSPDWTIGFLGGPVGTATSALQPLDPPGSTFRGAAGTPAAGYFFGQTPTIPGTAPGGSGLVLLRVTGPGGVTLDIGPYTVNNLGGGTITPPNLALGTSPIPYPIFWCPEPSSGILLLGGAGVLALFALRGRSALTS